jgi:homoserine O-acetyltransferase
LTFRIWLLAFSLICATAAADSGQQMATIGDLQLASGETLHDAQVGYRTAGTSNEDKTNVIVFLTWFTGTTVDLFNSQLIGPGKLADTDQYFVIAIDALGNGVSTSPSNSQKQPGKQFPGITISDMASSQHELLTEHLGITQADAVMGISMGGMQTFTWMGQYPNFMNKAIPIDGSPRMTSYDLLQWQTHEEAIVTMQEAGVENEEITGFLAYLNLLTLWTPGYFVENITPEDLPQFLEDSSQGYVDMDASDYLSQLRAMMQQDVYAANNTSDIPYLDKVKADVLVISATGDQMVNPEPGKVLSRNLNARHEEINSNCGHIGTTCEAASVSSLVHAFLK